MCSRVLAPVPYRRAGDATLVGAAVLLALIPVAVTIPALAALGLVSAVCALVVAYEVTRHRADRIRVRHPERPA
jgi:hypothetical protein